MKIGIRGLPVKMVIAVMSEHQEEAEPEHKDYKAQLKERGFLMNCYQKY